MYGDLAHTLTVPGIDNNPVRIVGIVRNPESF
jgi:hypothetical protein